MTLYLISHKTNGTVGRMMNYMDGNTEYERVGRIAGVETPVKITEDFFLGLMGSLMLHPDFNEYIQFEDLIEEKPFKRVHGSVPDKFTIESMTHKELYDQYIKDSPQVLVSGILYDPDRRLVVIKHKPEVMEALMYNSREARKEARRAKRAQGVL